MDIWLVLLLILGALFLLALLFSAVFSFNGVWERIDNDSQFGPKERIRLAQFASIVLGKRTVVGGTQSFFGFAFANHLWLTRRDRGIVSLKKEGFPEDVAKQVEGSVMARYSLRLSGDHLFLNGHIIPYRVEFSLDPAHVTAMHAQAAVARRYRRIELISEKEIATVSSSAD